MNKKFNIAAMAGRIAFIIAILFLVAYIITIVTGSAVFYTESAERTALVSFDDDLAAVNALAERHYENLYGIADRLQYSESAEEVEGIIKSYIESPLFGDLRYYSNGVSYSPQGAVVEEETSGHDLITALAASKKRGCTEVYHDTSTGKNCMAFFVPVRGSAFVDGVLSIVEARNVIDVSSAMDEKAAAVALISSGGEVFSDKTSSELSLSVGSDYYKFISTLTNDKEMVIRVGEAISLGERCACSITANGSEYTLAISPVDSFDGKLFFISMSESRGLVSAEMAYIRHIVNVLVIAIASLVIGLVYAALYYKYSQNALTEANLSDPKIGCANGEQFKRTVDSTVHGTDRNYAVAVFEIRQYRYLADTLSDDDETEVMKYIAKVIDTFCSERESFGYLGEGKFVLLILYNSERVLRDKIKLIETVANKHDILINIKTKLKFNVGVAISTVGKRRRAQELIDRAIASCDRAKTDVKVPYIIYTEEVNADREHDDRIEAQMESALENGEFRLFLQPKYNVAGDRIDSAEALVRWFDPRRGEYMFPAEFISLFEANGFITKIDHFIYLQVLEYMSGAVERGDKIVPVAVNVSRVTASSDDFLDFYIGNKKKYRIGDGFITLELTESFAMEDYDKIYEIVDSLHKNGMLCSIDDFGSGYSSFSMLKKIPMDEIKLDRLFLEEGVDGKRDEIMLGTIISLAKSLGMKVVQEGVETKDMFDRVIAMGCDTVQGYYYAKAIPLEEYKIFINSNTSIKFKALVK